MSTDAATRADPDARFLVEADVWMIAPVMSAAALGELLVHGFDIARAAAVVDSAELRFRGGRKSWLGLQFSGMLTSV